MKIVSSVLGLVIYAVAMVVLGAHGPIYRMLIGGVMLGLAFTLFEFGFDGFSKRKSRKGTRK